MPLRMLVTDRSDRIDPRHAAALPDAELVGRARAAEATAIDELYRRHADAVMRVAYHLLGGVEEAEDVVQDVFVGLPVALRQYDERGKLDGWLRTIAARLALTRLRTRRRRREVALDEGGDRPAPASGDAIATRLALRDAIAALPETLRVVFVLKEVEGYSHDEIARLLDIRPGTSQVRLFRAVRLLRDILKSAH
jgi:RNA polymerase sigma-70 factor, ECF subfamily